MSDQNSTNSAIPVKKPVFVERLVYILALLLVLSWSHKRDTCYSGLGQSVERSHGQRVFQNTALPDRVVFPDHLLLDDAGCCIEKVYVA